MFQILLNMRLKSAIYRGDLDAVEMLLGRGANPECRDPQGFTALMLASGESSVPVIRALVTAGADINRSVRVSHPMTSGVTPLMAACCDSTGLVAPVRALLELGADPELTDSLGRTAHDYAEFSGYSEIVAFLAETIGPTPP